MRPYQDQGHVYSLFATCSTYAYSLTRWLVSIVDEQTGHFTGETQLSTYVTTQDGIEWAS